MALTTVTRVAPARVRALLLASLELFSKGSNDDGKFWVKGMEKTGSPVLGDRYGYCSIGAIHNVPGFTDEERVAAKIALAKMIDKDLYGGGYLEDQRADYDDEVDMTYETNPYLAEDLIVNVNDDDYTEWNSIRNWFSRAASFVKKG